MKHGTFQAVTYHEDGSEGCEVKTGTVLKMEGKDGLGLLRIGYTRPCRCGTRLIRLKTPKPVEGGLCRWRVDHCVFYDNIGEDFRLLRRFYLLAKTETAARKKWRELDKAIQIEEARQVAELKAHRPQKATWLEDLNAAQWKVLEDVFPKTVRLLRKAAKASETERAELNRQAAAEYKAEFLRSTSELIDGHATEDEMRRIEKALRRKAKTFDEVDFELALYYYRKRYNNMKPQELADAIYHATKKRLSAKAVKQRRKRLGLVSDNREGRPDWKWDKS